MAEIKMDVSEYEAMKENTKLLKQALEREKQLGEEIKKLNKDKIEALQKIPNKVVHTISQQSFEEIFISREPREIAYNILRSLERATGERLSLSVSRFSPQSLVDYLSAEIVHNKEMFFKKETYKSEPIESHEYIGFEEVRTQVKKHFEKNLDETTASILESYPKVKNKLSETERSLKLLHEQHNKVLDDNFDLAEENKKLLKEVEKQEKIVVKYEKAFSKVYHTLKIKAVLGYVKITFMDKLLKEVKDE